MSGWGMVDGAAPVRGGPQVCKVGKKKKWWYHTQSKHLIAHKRLCYVSNDVGFRIRIALDWCFSSVMVALCERGARLSLAGAGEGSTENNRVWYVSSLSAVSPR